MTTPSLVPGPVDQPSRVYPVRPELLPTIELTAGRYVARFARTAAELDDALRLRFEVFNLELGEGLQESFATERDSDAHDWRWHHLLVWDRESGQVIGTYRMQTVEMADEGTGFYSDAEYDLSALPLLLRSQSVELGRACIAREHRNKLALLLLWKGLASYLVSTGKRYLFGCSSITSQDPRDGLKVEQQLRDSGHMAALRVEPHAELRCNTAPELEGRRPSEDEIRSWPEIQIPKLFRTYLRYGSKICSGPAMDREFKSIDFLTLLDIEDLSPRARSMFFP